MNMSHTTGLWQDQKLNVDMFMLSFLNVTATQVYIQSPGTEEASEGYNNLKYYTFPVSHDNLHFLPVHCFHIEVSSFQQLLCRKITYMRSYSHISYFSVCMKVNPRTEHIKQLKANIFFLVHLSMKIHMQNHEFCCMFVVMQGNPKNRKRKASLIALFYFQFRKENQIHLVNQLCSPNHLSHL